jgi:hypothetical protein
MAVLKEGMSDFQIGNQKEICGNVGTGTIDNGCLASQGDVELETAGRDDAGVRDKRLVEFLRSFANKGTACVTVGHMVLKTETGERSDSGKCSVIIENGTLLKEDAQKFLGYLDALEIKDALPPFSALEDDWDETYILKNGAWELYEWGMSEEVLYLHCNFYSGIKDRRL